MAVVLVTGSHGFIGTHVCDALRERGDTVVTVDWLEPRVHGDNPKPADLDYAGRSGTIPYQFLDVDAVVHLAAQVGVADSMTEPVRYVRDNTLDTTEFWMALTNAHLNHGKIKRVVVASSMSIYGHSSCKGIRETAPVVPASVYGLTKYDQECLSLMLGKTVGIPTIALRFFNVYGPGQALHNPYTGVLANFANNMRRGEPPVVYEDGYQTRDFIHVRDVTRAVLAALDSTWVGAVNIGTGEATSIRRAAHQLARAMGRDIPAVVTHTYRPGDIRHCTANVALALQAIGWGPAIKFIDGIRHYGASLA
jgi:dTDP-L-rhamnose 4-epimerase